jgi:hypothetical protein
MSEGISLCACMGPINGEPMCPCQMKAAGLRTSKDYEWTDAEKEAFKKALAPYCQQNHEVK